MDRIVAVGAAKTKAEVLIDEGTVLLVKILEDGPGGEGIDGVQAGQRWVVQEDVWQDLQPGAAG